MFRANDVERVRQIKEWQIQRLSLSEIRQRLNEREVLAEPSQISQRFLEHAVNGDSAEATTAVLLADDLGLPLTQIFDEILRPALYEVGARWATGHLAVGQEHEISELAQDLIAELTLRHARIDPHGQAVVAACVAGEHHDLGLRMVMSVLRQRGLRVHFLGANVDSGFLIESVRLRRPDLVVLSASLDIHCSAIRATVVELRNTMFETGRPKVIVGGQGCIRQRSEMRDDDITIIADDRLEIIANTIMSLAQCDS